MQSNSLPSIPVGKRVVLSGRTGSGKSTLGCWLLGRSPQHWVILNPKWTKAYSKLPDASVMQKYERSKLDKSLIKNRFSIINFPGQQSNAEFFDAIVEDLHERYENIGLCCDELYTMHNRGQCGPGLIGWLTRGRELKQSFLGLTQRPAWVSRFLYSEADYIGTMDLSLEDDRKKLVGYTGNDHFLDRLDNHRWLWYDVGRDEIKKFGPVPL